MRTSDEEEWLFFKTRLLFPHERGRKIQQTPTEEREELEEKELEEEEEVEEEEEEKKKSSAKIICAWRA